MDKQFEYLVETRNLTRIYGDGEQIRALDNVNLCVETGELVTVMGPSGSGKSTLLNMIGALDKPTSGEVLINGEDLTKIKNKDHFRARTVGFMFQLHNLIPTLTARENVEIPMMGQLGLRERWKRSAELLELVGLVDRMNHLPNQLSGGQRQRVAVARSLANRPQLVLADEPTGSLDSSAGQSLMGLLRDLNQTQGTTFIVVTHDQAVARQTNRVLVMEDGRIVEEGNPEEMFSSPREERTKLFLSQIQFAVVHNKPIMIHARDAYQEILDILQQLKGEYGNKLRGNVHFFAGSLDEAKKFSELNFTISFTGVITFSRDYDEVIKNTPLNMLMSETDAPFVAPTPYRGKRNEPSYVSEIIRKIAEIRDEDAESIRTALVNNALSMIG